MFDTGVILLRGPPLDIRGGGLEFLPRHFFFSEGRWKALFVHLRIGCISPMPCAIYLFHPFPHKNMYFQKTPPVFPSILTGT